MYAPNCDQPLDICYDMTGSGQVRPAAWFAHSQMMQRLVVPEVNVADGDHFWRRELLWNGLQEFAGASLQAGVQPAAVVRY